MWGSLNFIGANEKMVDLNSACDLKKEYHESLDLNSQIEVTGIKVHPVLFC